jgi:phosphomannomutase
MSDLRRAVQSLLESPPAALGQYDVTKVHDLEKGIHGLPPTEGVWIMLGELGRVVVRPSGTEAKVKAYLEITPPIAGTLDEQRARAAVILASVRDSLSELLRV